MVFRACVDILLAWKLGNLSAGGGALSDLSEQPLRSGDVFEREEKKMPKDFLPTQFAKPYDSDDVGEIFFLAF